MKRRKQIVIRLEGGLIQGIRGIPKGVEILVRDYDVEGAAANELSKDEDGEECFEAVWEKDDG